ncbi:hypothetical protein [Saccharopolyspora phatthalungensis]|uniref:Uncharacterized protein n=1 Tax=Saccharopolyspora phatthalungensis TaxID=664693 RepID=A0A840QGU2_9PSEU|nr:hypothetical protein [Saccharopolyspora phatthalungensis]MBB5159321.1 hypothetical protein [Saccharopolyspora phatthalungensis]
MNDYQTLPGLAEVYLEDSFVLGIHEGRDSLSFDLDAVLTEQHPRYTPPPDEQYCYVNATLSFTRTTVIDWISRTDASYRDANDEIDQGNIDFLTVDDDTYRLGGDWGEVAIQSSTPPEFRIEE